MITTLVVILGVLLILVGIPLYFIKMSEGKGGGTPFKIGAYVPDYDYKHLVHAFGLFTVLFAVLWFTNNKLGWYSFMTRDGWTFVAFVVAYIAFAPAFMQEKDKTKKTPIFKKIMVFVTIIAVILAFTDGVKNPFTGWGKKEEAPLTAQMAPPPARVVETIIANGDRFTYKSIPDGMSIEFFCPNGTLMDFTYNGIPEEEKGFIDCDTGGKDLVLGAWKTGRRIGFMSKDAFPKNATVTTVSTNS